MSIARDTAKRGDEREADRRIGHGTFREVLLVSAPAEWERWVQSLPEIQVPSARTAYDPDAAMSLIIGGFGLDEAPLA